MTFIGSDDLVGWNSDLDCSSPLREMGIFVFGYMSSEIYAWDIESGSVLGFDVTAVKTDHIAYFDQSLPLKRESLYFSCFLVLHSFNEFLDWLHGKFLIER